MAVTKERQPVYDWSTGDLISESRMDAMQSNHAYALQALQTYYWHSGSSLVRFPRTDPAAATGAGPGLYNDVSGQEVRANLSLDSECLIYIEFLSIDLGGVNEDYILGFRFRGSANTNRDITTPAFSPSSQSADTNRLRFFVRLAAGTWSVTLIGTSNGSNPSRQSISATGTNTRTMFVMRVYPTPTDGITAFDHSGDIPLFSN